MREACTLTEDFVVQKELADHGLGVRTRVVLVKNQSQTSCKISLYTRWNQAGKRSSKASIDILEVGNKGIQSVQFSYYLIRFVYLLYIHVEKHRNNPSVLSGFVFNWSSEYSTIFKSHPTNLNVAIIMVKYTHIRRLH
jgi:hypothetical protein